MGRRLCGAVTAAKRATAARLSPLGLERERQGRKERRWTHRPARGGRGHGAGPEGRRHRDERPRARVQAGGWRRSSKDRPPPPTRAVRSRRRGRFCAISRVPRWTWAWLSEGSSETARSKCGIALVHASGLRKQRAKRILEERGVGRTCVSAWASSVFAPFQISRSGKSNGVGKRLLIRKNRRRIRSQRLVEESGRVVEVAK